MDKTLDAYYFSFESTGVEVVDAILASVASAGSAYHHTEDWNEWGSQEKCEAEKIQDAANKAAASFRAALQPSAWISCAERLPTEADEYVWVWDADIKAPAIEIWSQVVMFRDRYDYTHWMPTGLTRPQPPEGV